MRRALLAMAAAAAGCSGCSQGAGDPGSGKTPPALARCLGTPFTPAPARAWRHAVASTAIVALGPPGHSMQDVLARPGSAASIRGKFAYGAISKDLEDEAVRVFIDACAGWTSLGDFLTSGDGRISAPVPPALGAGVYEVRLQVLGDGSVAPGRLWLLPAGTHLAVSDIDGTLTTSDDELVQDVMADLYQPILGGRFVPAAYPGAAALTGALVGRGQVLVYLTGRPYWLTGRTRDWLSAGAFAAGPLHLADSNGEALPTPAGVGAFKLAFLRSLTAQGFVLDEAYGNAATDVSAYAGAGLAPGATWIIGPNGGRGGTNAAAGSWTPRSAAVAALPPVTQPFGVP